MYLARGVKTPHTDCQVVACREGVTSPRVWGRPVFIHSLAKLHPLPPVDVAPANRALQHTSFVKLNVSVQYQSCMNIRQQGSVTNKPCCFLSDNFGNAWKTLLILLIALWRGFALRRYRQQTIQQQLSNVNVSLVGQAYEAFVNCSFCFKQSDRKVPRILRGREVRRRDTRDVTRNYRGVTLRTVSFSARFGCSDSFRHAGRCIGFGA